jgi:hypothetical protein
MNNTPEEKEVWLDVLGYEGVYQISNHGRVKSIGRKRLYGKKGILKERILKNSINSDGYMMVKLYNNNNKKTIKVHVLVARAFCLKEDHTNQVNHIDANKTNNYYKNLEYVTHAGNVQHAYENKLNKWKKYYFDEDNILKKVRQGLKISELAKMMGCSAGVARYYLKKGIANESNITIR